MSSQAAISARMVLRVVAYCEARGHDPEALCRGAGVSLAALREPDARLPYTLAAAIGERALRLTGDADFGLRLAYDVGDAGQYDAGLLYMMASPSVRVALERMIARQRYWGDGERAQLFPTEFGASLRYTLPGGVGEYARHSEECALAEVALGVRALSGEPLHPRAVRFRHARPANISLHHTVFQCGVAFDAPATELDFDRAVLDAPMRNGNAAFSAIFAEQVERAIARLPVIDTASEHVRSAVRAALGSGGCTLEGTARALGLSARTLQRRLHEEGTSFVALVDALRRELSVAYLERGLPIGEVAALLGYADATAFHHAFQRWTGTSPARHGAT